MMSRPWQELSADFATLLSVENPVADDDEFFARAAALFDEAAALPIHQQVLLSAEVLVCAASMQERILQDNPNLALRLQLARQLDLGGNN
jgi:hypothetical protein